MSAEAEHLRNVVHELLYEAETERRHPAPLAYQLKLVCAAALRSLELAEQYRREQEDRKLWQEEYKLTRAQCNEALRQRALAVGALEALYTWGEMDPRQRSPELTAKVLGLVHDVIPAVVEAEHARRQREGGR